MHIRFAAMALIMATAVSAGAEDPLNILFYGNSFTIGTGFGSTSSVNAVVRDIAVAAGHPQPHVASGAVAGQSLGWHRTNNTAIITTGIPSDNEWDYVVLQDYSTRPTHIGSLAAHRADFLALYDLVRNHSPGARAIGFETWARAPGHSYYPGTFANPAQMQQELRDGYALSTADVVATFGDGASQVASVGSAWENAGWQSLHHTDLYHANNRGTLLAAMMIYGTAYGDGTISDIDLSGVLSNLSLSPSEGAFLAGVADTTLPEPSAALLLVLSAVMLRRR